MSKIFILSNTRFNAKKDNNWIKNLEKYYYEYFIPYIKENYDDNDILIHLGGLLHNNNSIELKLMNTIQDIFEKLAKILPIYMLEGKNDKLPLNIIKNINNIEIISKPTEINLLLEQRFALFPYNTTPDDLDKFSSEYGFFNFDFENSTNKDLIISKMKFFKSAFYGHNTKNHVISNIKILGTPYNIDDDINKGFIILETHTNKAKFILNTISPGFKTINIETIEDFKIESKILDNNYIFLKINKKLGDDNKIKLDLLLSHKNITNYIFIDDILEDKKEIILDDKILLLEDMIIDYINKSNPNIKNELTERFKMILTL